MPSKKGSTAYRAQNARKQADRWMKNLLKIAKPVKAGAFSLNQRATARQMVTLFGKLKSQTYQPKGKATPKSDEEINVAIERIRTLANSASIIKGQCGAANLLTQQQINLASKAGKSPADNVSMYSREEVKAFYRATQNLWQPELESKYDKVNINKTIMRALGTNSLQEAFEFVTSLPEVKRALLSYDIESGKLRLEDMDAEQTEMYEQLSTMDTADSDQGSPIFLSLVGQIASDAESIKSLRAAFKEWKRNQQEG